MKNLFKGMLCGSILALSSLTANAGLFNINIADNGGLTTSQSAIFDIASSFWQSHIIGTQADADISLTINASGQDIDGVNGILGSAGPNYVGGADGFLYTTIGSMRFDIADLASLESSGALFAVILHEMAHVMGFGTLWNPSDYGFLGYQSVYVNGTGQYTGAHGLAMYQEEFNLPSASYIPVELDGGPGTANGHWDETWLTPTGNDSDLMTGYLNFPTTLSNTTLASFADIGYIVRLDDGRIIGAAAIPTPATLVLFMSAFLVLMSRNPKVKATF
ncbi:leishmanolysin [Colwellia sp. D2M02]|uniref:leishmanolysin n=1 Tax=Colwellia sp. D2M02 TaxID=2841562 RepID=UPI00209148C0|nr:leishmanolysin [Colwellia sp. D2M02]